MKRRVISQLLTTFGKINYFLFIAWLVVSKFANNGAMYLFMASGYA